MDRDFLIDLFSDFGPVTIRPMFSGYGISADGINFAMALRAGLYFRADDQTIPQFEAEGSKPFQYQTRAKTVTIGSYWQLPARLFDDPEELTRLVISRGLSVRQTEEWARREKTRPGAGYDIGRASARNAVRPSDKLLVTCTPGSGGASFQCIVPSGNRIMGFFVFAATART